MTCATGREARHSSTMAHGLLPYTTLWIYVVSYFLFQGTRVVIRCNNVPNETSVRLVTRTCLTHCLPGELHLLDRYPRPVDLRHPDHQIRSYVTS